MTSMEGYILSEWIDNFLKEHGVISEIGQPRACDSRGTKYDTLCLGGVKEEGTLSELWATSVDAATKHFGRFLLEYLNGRKKIIWRSFPEVRVINTLETPLFQVYCRLTAYKE